MNEYDSNRIYDLTSIIGYNKPHVKKEADCFVLNTCHIRKKATEKVYDEIGRVKKDFKNLKKPLVVVSGCVAQAESEEMIKREPYIDMVIGPQSYHKIGDFIFLIFLSLSYLSLSNNLTGKKGYLVLPASIMDVKGDSKITPAKFLF